MKREADHSDTIAQQAVIQASAAQANATAAQSTAETTLRSLELTERPWLSAVATPKSSLTYSSDGVGRLTLHYVIHNSGHAPAIEVKVTPQFYLEYANKPIASVERAKLCSNQEANNDRYGMAIFPGSTTELDRIINLSPADAEISSRANDHEYIEPYIIDCVGYRSTFTKKFFFTATIYTLQEKGNAPDTVQLMAPKREIPLEKLRMLLFEPNGVLTQ